MRKNGVTFILVVLGHGTETMSNMARESKISINSALRIDRNEKKHETDKIHMQNIQVCPNVAIYNHKLLTHVTTFLYLASELVLT